MSEYDAAKKRAREIAGFYRHAMSYFSTMMFLFVLNLITSPGDLWVQWPALIWGFFLVKQAWCVFGLGNSFGKDWEERKAAELMGRKPKRKNAEDYFDEIVTE
jgi:hypothetical protein